jgi:hypothetical protein
VAANVAATAPGIGEFSQLLYVVAAIDDASIDEA